MRLQIANLGKKTMIIIQIKIIMIFLLLSILALASAQEDLLKLLTEDIDGPLTEILKEICKLYLPRL